MLRASLRSSIAFVLLCLLAIYGLSAQAGGARVALIIGNGAYAASPLKNPPNDAEDLAAALRDCGFSVSLKKDLDLAGFDRAVEEFAGSLKGADTGLFYYAGHGVQVEGLNYLIPVSPRIDDAASVKYQAVPVDRIVAKMEAAGVRTALVFLDSCRDNPFPGASRSGTRGLAVVGTPRTTNSLIAYATSPGDTAQDGSGRNGVFSGALLKQLLIPGQELGSLMRKVKAEVASVTGGKQQPRVDDGMKESYYFLSAEMAAARAKGASDAAARELAALEAEIAARAKAIQAATDSRKKQELEVEQQKARALEAAKRLEAENAALEARRLIEERDRQAREAETRRSAEAEELARTVALKEEAERKKAEMAALSRNDDSAEAYLRQIAALEEALSDIAARYATARQKGEADIAGRYAVKLEGLAALQADPWESDAEFQARRGKEQARLEGERQTELLAYGKKTEAERAAQEKELRARLERTEAELAAKVYVLKGSAVIVSYGAFDRDKKAWSVRFSSADPAFLFNREFTHSLASVPDLRAAYTAVDTALKAGAVAGEISYKLAREKPGEGRFIAMITGYRIFDLTSGQVFLSGAEALRVFALESRNPVRRITTGTLNLKVEPAGAKLELDGGPAQAVPGSLELSAGEHRLRIIWPGKDLAPQEVQLSVDVNAVVNKAVRGSLVELVSIPGGSFPMGSNGGDSDERPVHEVRLSGFRMGKYEVTQALYQRVMGKNPSNFTGEPNRPVEMVSWYEAVEFCNKLSKLEGLKPCYTISGTEVSCDWSANGYRLPTEAEWEYAAQGGGLSLAASAKYAGSENLDAVAWYMGNSGSKTHPVGQKAPNALGLYDMAGNVWEWCWDWYGSYTGAAASDPLGASSGGCRVIRGGSWDYGASYARSALRNYDIRGGRRNFLGFRLVSRP